MRDFKNHDLVDDTSKPACATKQPPGGRRQRHAEGLYNAWIIAQRPGQCGNTRPTWSGRDLTIRAASNARDVELRRLHRRRRQGFLHRQQHQGTPSTTPATTGVPAVFCRLFNDMVSAILACESR